MVLLGLTIWVWHLFSLAIESVTIAIWTPCLAVSILPPVNRGTDNVLLVGSSSPVAPAINLRLLPR